MSEFTGKPNHRLSRDNDVIRVVENRQQLRSRPKHFFSNDFSLAIENKVPTQSEIDPGIKLSRLGRFIDLNLALLILFVGVPVIIYCVIKSALE